MNIDIENSDLLRRYLLDQATEAEMAAVEQSFIADDGMFEQITAVEDELFYEYSAGELTDAEAEVFNAKFLASPEGRDRLSFASAFLEASNDLVETKVSVAAGSRSLLASLSAFFGLSRNAMTYGLSAAVLLLAVTAGILIYQGRRATQDVASIYVVNVPEITVEPQAPRRAPETNNNVVLASTPEGNRNVASNSDDVTKPRQTPKKDTSSPGRSFVALVLSPGFAVRSDGSVLRPVKLDKDLRTVGLYLEFLPREEFELYRAEVREVDTGAAISSSGTKKYSGFDLKKFKVTVPADKLKNADYEVAMFGVKPDGTSEELFVYYFSARK